MHFHNSTIKIACLLLSAKAATLQPEQNRGQITTHSKRSQPRCLDALFNVHLHVFLLHGVWQTKSVGIRNIPVSACCNR